MYIINNILLLGYTCEPHAVIVFVQMYVCRARSPDHHTWCQCHSIEKMTFTEISGQQASITSMFLSRVVVWGEAALEAGGITIQKLTLRRWAFYTAVVSGLQLPEVFPSGKGLPFFSPMSAFATPFAYSIWKGHSA